VGVVGVVVEAGAQRVQPLPWVVQVSLAAQVVSGPQAVQAAQVPSSHA
jgi:hypothetical protein